MTTYTMTRTVSYTVRSTDTKGTADTSDDTTVERVHTRVETYEVDLPDPPATRTLDPTTNPPANARLVSADEFEDLDGDGQHDAGEQSLATHTTGPVTQGQVVTQTSDDALAASREHFIVSSGNAGTIGGTVVDYDLTQAANAETTQLLEANAPFEEQALAELSAEDRARYERVMQALAADPNAQLALQVMLIDGRLPGEPALVGTTTATECTMPLTTLQQLEKMITQPIDPAIAGGADLLATVVKEIAFPEGISQGPKGTCMASSAIAALALYNPSEYVRIVMGLASPTGSVMLANGTTLHRETNTLADDGSGRTVSQRLLAPALMELGNGSLDYDNDRDKSAIILGGLYQSGQEAIAEALWGTTFDSHFTITTGLGLGYSNANIARDAWLDGERPVMISAFFPNFGQGHGLLLMNVEQVGDEYYFTLLNPWGQLDRVSYEELSAHITGVTQPGN